MAAPKFKTKRAFTPIGMLLHCHVNKPDSKYPSANGGMKYKTKLVLEGDGALEFSKTIDDLCDQAWDAETAAQKAADMKPADMKKWAKAAAPYENEEDDEGNPTGRIVFKFSQNATIKLKDGEVKELSIALVDSKGNAAKVNVFSGTIGRIGYSTRSYQKADGKVVGLTLDFDMVKIIKPSTRAASVDEEEGWTVGDDDFGGDAPNAALSAQKAAEREDDGTSDF